MSTFDRRNPLITQVPPTTKPCSPPKPYKSDECTKLDSKLSTENQKLGVEEALQVLQTRATRVSDDACSDTYSGSSCSVDSVDESDEDGMQVMRQVFSSMSERVKRGSELSMTHAEDVMRHIFSKRDADVDSDDESDRIQTMKHIDDSLCHTLSQEEAVDHVMRQILSSRGTLDSDGMQLMRRSEGATSSSSPLTRLVEDDKRRECRKRLEKTILKYPRNGFNLIASGRQRYFAIKTSMRGDSLCYWTNEVARKEDDPLGSIPIASITDVIHKTDQDRELRVKVIAGDNELTLRFNTSLEAENWVSDLQEYIRLACP